MFVGVRHREASRGASRQTSPHKTASPSLSITLGTLNNTILLFNALNMPLGRKGCQYRSNKKFRRHCITVCVCLPSTESVFFACTAVNSEKRKKYIAVVQTNTAFAGAPGAVHDPFTGTHPADQPAVGLQPQINIEDIQLPFSRRASVRSMLRSNLQTHMSGGHQSTNELLLGVAQANGLAQPDPLRQDSGSGEPVSRDRTGWETATAGTPDGSKGGKNHDKTERQQMLNKAAQQRCVRSASSTQWVASCIWKRLYVKVSQHARLQPHSLRA